MGERLDRFFNASVKHEEGNPDLLLSLKENSQRRVVPFAGACASGAGAAIAQFMPK